MKKKNIQLIAILLVISLSGCNQKTEICECFELRLKMKKMTKESENPNLLAETEEFKVLSDKKKECLTKIEPAYFEEKNIERHGRDDKEFLLEELSECQAVKELLSTEDE